MRPHARVLGAAAAWALVGSGCDFWRNLTEPHKADKVDLVVTVKDAWTGEALPWARCTLDSARANADSEGRVLFAGGESDLTFFYLDQFFCFEIAQRPDQRFGSCAYILGNILPGNFDRLILFSCFKFRLNVYQSFCNSFSQ